MKCLWSEPITTISSGSNTVRDNCNNFKRIQSIVWGNGLELFQLKHAMFQPIIMISRKTRIVWFNCFIASKSGSVSVNDNYSNSNVWHPNGFPGLHSAVWKFWRWKSESSEEGTLSGNSRFSSIFAVTSYEFLGQKSGKTLCFRFQLTTKSEKQSVCKNDILYLPTHSRLKIC